MSTLDDQVASSGPNADRRAPFEDRLERRAVHRDGRTLFILAAAVVALLASVMAVGCSSRAVDQTKPTPVAPGPSTPATGAPAAATIHLREFAIEPKGISVAEGATLQVTNVGTVTHNLALKDTTLATPMLNAGATANLSLAGLAPGTYTLYCQVPGHEQAGMTATLHVGSATG